MDVSRKIGGLNARSLSLSLSLSLSHIHAFIQQIHSFDDTSKKHNNLSLYRQAEHANKTLSSSKLAGLFLFSIKNN